MAAVFTNLGEYWLTDLILGGSAATTWAIGWGTGSATEAKADVDLHAPATETRVTATSEGERATASDEAEWIGTLTAGTSKTVYEAALYWKSTGTASTIFIHGSHAAIALATDDQVQYTFRLEQT